MNGFLVKDREYHWPFREKVLEHDSIFVSFFCPRKFHDIHSHDLEWELNGD